MYKRSSLSRAPRCWSELPTDLLELVMHRLTSFLDHLRFGTVCTSWHATLLECRHRLVPTDPLLMLPDEDDDEMRQLFSLEECKTYRLRLPHAPRHLQFCFGSSIGWLTTLHNVPKVVIPDGKPAHEIQLINPLSGARVQLPPASTFYMYAAHSPRSYNLRAESFMYKAVLSSDPQSADCVVMAIHACERMLGFCRVGDERWTRVETEWASIEDVVYYRGRFYAVTTRGRVLACLPGSAEAVEVAAPARVDCLDKKYLVESCGELLMVTRYVRWRPTAEGHKREEMHWTVRMDVLKLDVERGTWSEVGGLGGRALLLGNSCSMSVPAPAAGFRANCIYFTDDAWDFYSAHDSADFDCHDMGVFDMDDGSIWPIHCPTRIWTSAQFWFVPNPR